jgi:hypothetical protein
MRTMLFPCLLLASGCAHDVKRADPAALQSTAEQFHERIRWRDFRGASELLVPERRDAFLSARKADEKDFSVTDYEVGTAKVGPVRTHAEVKSRLKWVRLPSATENDAELTTELVDYHGTWLLARQQGGPFDAELGAPYVGPPEEDGGS